MRVTPAGVTPEVVGGPTHFRQNLFEKNTHIRKISNSVHFFGLWSCTNSASLQSKAEVLNSATITSAVSDMSVFQCFTVVDSIQWVFYDVLIHFPWRITVCMIIGALWQSITECDGNLNNYMTSSVFFKDLCNRATREKYASGEIKCPLFVVILQVTALSQSRGRPPILAT